MSWDHTGRQRVKDAHGFPLLFSKDLLKGKSEPLFILEGASRFDIQQGEAGKNSTSFFLALDGGRLPKVHLWAAVGGEKCPHPDP